MPALVSAQNDSIYNFPNLSTENKLFDLSLPFPSFMRGTMQSNDPEILDRTKYFLDMRYIHKTEDTANIEVMGLRILAPLMFIIMPIIAITIWKIGVAILKIASN